MGETTRISWTDSTWNCWQGCHKVSPGCKNCYAEALVQNRMGRDFRDIRRSAPTTFNAPLKWREGRRIFTCSISDFFIEEADAWRDEAWEIIRRTPQHTYQILTKRPERIADRLPDGWDAGWPNVWLGTSVENQEYAWKRIPWLTSVPAAVHFLSCEPLLGPIQFDLLEEQWWPGRIVPALNIRYLLKHVEWVICGGESGPNYRPMDPSWARDIRAQCAATGVPFFFKQSSGPRSEMNPTLDGQEWREMPKVYAATLNRSASAEYTRVISEGQ